MTEIDKIESLLRDLAGSFIEFPKDLQITTQLSDDGKSRLLVMKGNPKDESKLVGKNGCHIRALNFIVITLGWSRGEVWTFRLVTESTHPNPFQKRKYALKFDPKPHCDLLRRLMVAYQIPCTVSVGPGNGERDMLSYEFTITVVAGEFDFYGALTKPPLAAYGEKTILNSIDTIFRGIALFNGVRFQVAVAKV